MSEFFLSMCSFDEPICKFFICQGIVSGLSGGLSGEGMAPHKKIRFAGTTGPPLSHSKSP